MRINPVRSVFCAALALSLDSVAQAQTAATAAASAPAAPIPHEFLDPDTHARILHLSRAPNDASGVIYFHQACVTADSHYALVRYLDVAAGHTAGYLYRFDLQTQELTKLTDRLTRYQNLFAKSGNVYYSSDHEHALYTTHMQTMATRKFADIPPELLCADGIAINADETLAAGVATLAAEQNAPPDPNAPPNRGSNFTQTFARHDTYVLFTVDIKTGAFKELQRIKTWLGHTQFSPTDPNLLLFCHEGPWAQVDRIWTVRVNDGSAPSLVFKRSEPQEIGGHEFWAPDGKSIWFDHDFRDPANPARRFVAGKDLASGKYTEYRIAPEFASIHYTWSPDGKFLVGDGNTRKNDVNAQAMYILIPSGDTFKSIKLCNMAKNSYAAAEPNPHITPDQHWVLFTATLFGTPQAYAVALPREFWRE